MNFMILLRAFTQGRIIFMADIFLKIGNFYPAQDQVPSKRKVKFTLIS